MFAATLFLAAAAGPADAGLPAPEPWWAAVVREETARVIAADLPEAPRRFRFQCRVASRAPDTRRYLPAECISADAGTVKTAEELTARAAEERLQPLATAEDRLRFMAWKRVKLLHHQDEAQPQPALFEVEESIGKADLPQRAPAADTLPYTAFVITALPNVAMSSRTLLEDGRGDFTLLCRITPGEPDCRLEAPAPLKLDRQWVSGWERGWFWALRDVHNGLRQLRVAPQLQDGRPALGMDLRIRINLQTAG